MNEELGIGLLIGIATGVSLYIWGNDNFTKLQKIGLICCVIFPPLQWISILLVLAYNKYKFENTTEAKTIKQNDKIKQNLDLAKDNLTELREKGIITDEEFNSKFHKIESQKTEFEIKNSVEYKQLKNLLDNGILTKEEFENKIKSLNNFIDDEFDNKGINEILSSVNEVILNESENKVENNKHEKYWNYILPIAFVIIFFSVIIYSEYEKVEQDSTETINESVSPTNNSNYQEPIKNKKFVFILTKTERPYLTGYKSEYYEIKSYCSVEFKEQEICSDIIEIEDYNEDTKYRLIDEQERKILINNEFISHNLYTNAIVKYGYEAAESLKDNKYGVKIIESEIFTFDSYSEASLYRRNN